MNTKIRNFIARKTPKVLRKEDFQGHDDDCGVGQNIQPSEDGSYPDYEHIEVTDYE